ncbi:hypothetical protein MCOR25_002723 [Pyricularia grisea]|nr:hypothetical protein MCOR25_002723 [Pyricularia grisea]
MQALSRQSETPYLPLGLRRGAPDLPNFSIDLNWAKPEAESTSRPRTYPSPPMSGSPSLPPISSQGVGDRSQGVYHTPASQDVRLGTSSAHGDFASHAPSYPTQPYHLQAQTQPPAPLPMTTQAQAHMGPYPHESFDRTHYGFDRSSEAQHRPAHYQSPAPGSILPPHPYMHHSSLGLGHGHLSSLGPPPTLSGPPQPSYSNPPRPSPQEPHPYTSPKTQRKTKGHVASACVPCKKAHLRCDSQRPCSRCISNGKEDSCVDVQHKKRGRPRLRDDREVRYDVSGRHGPSLEGSMRRPLSLYSQAPPPSHVGGYDDSMRRSQSYRVLKSLPSEGPAPPRYLERASASDANIFPAPLSIAPRQQEAVAFLTTEFEVAKTSSGFLDAIGRHSIKGLKLSDVVASTDRERVISLQTQLQDEQRRKEPSYLPPMFARQEEERIFHGLGFSPEEIARFSLDRQVLLTFNSQEGQLRTCTARFGLAKMESIFFVVVQLPSGIRAHGHLTPSPHPRDPRDSPFQYQSPLPQYQPQPPQPTPVSATFGSSRPRLGSDTSSVYGVRSQGTGPQMMPTHSPGMSSSSYAASPSRTEYPATVGSYQIPRSELPPATRPALPQQPTFQLPPIRSQQPTSTTAPPESSSWPRDDRLKVGGLIDNPESFNQPKPR